MPDAEAVGAALLGAAFLGDSDLVSDLLANWEPTALLKKPPPATTGSLETADTEGMQALLFLPYNVPKVNIARCWLNRSMLFSF